MFEPCIREGEDRQPVDMLRTCNYATHMSTMIQVRNVPDALHRKLKARAALAGQSLSDYVLGELRRSLDRPTQAEILERIRSHGRVDVHPSPAEAVRAERDSR